MLVPALPGPPRNHYECYKTRDLRAKAAYTMDLLAGVAGFTDQTGCSLKRAATQVCDEVTTRNVTPPPPGGGPAPGPGARQKFLVYKLKCPKGSVPPLGVSDQFGAGTVTPGTTKLLVVPAS